MNTKLDIITIGESLIELSTEGSLSSVATLDKYYGGDTLTTAISALRLGSKVGFISKVGLDCFNCYLLESWRNEGLDTSQVKPVNEANGLYIISQSNNCTSFEHSYYRKKTAATTLSIEDINPEYIQNCSLVYSTGITQSLSISAREMVKEAFKISKQNNIITAFDPNYSSKIWSGDEAREAFDELAEYIDILFLDTVYDSTTFIDINSIDNTIKHLSDMGITTVIIKSTEKSGYYIGYQGKVEFVNSINNEVVDDTGSGDAFNGGVLHGIVSGMSPVKAVTLGAIVESLQIKNIGAVKSIPDKESVYKIFKGIYE